MALRGGSFNSPVGAGRDGAGPAVSFALPPLQPVPPLPGMPPLQIQLPPMPPVVPGMPPPGPLSAPQTPAPEQEPDDGADPFRTNWLAMLDNALAADIVLLCGPDGDRVPCHRTVLLAQSAHFRNRFATSLLPDRIELPELPTPGVKIFLRFLYSGLPSSLHCFRDPLLAVDTLLVLEFFARDESNLTRFKEARKAVETQLIDAMPSQNAPRALARLNRYGMRSTFDHLLPAYLLHARSDPSRILSLLEGLDYRSFLAAVKSAEWKNEMQKFRIIRAWCGVNGASDDEKAELGGCVELERVTLDELEKEVEVRTTSRGMRSGAMGSPD